VHIGALRAIGHDGSGDRRVAFRDSRWRCDRAELLRLGSELAINIIE
jgi:hypothetical protein